MIKQNGKIIEATEEELHNRWLEQNIGEICDFKTYLKEAKKCKIVIENSMTMSEN